MRERDKIGRCKKKNRWRGRSGREEKRGRNTTRKRMRNRKRGKPKRKNNGGGR